jgi:hypothetical protein
VINNKYMTFDMVLDYNITCVLYEITARKLAEPDIAVVQHFKVIFDNFNINGINIVETVHRN